MPMLPFLWMAPGMMPNLHSLGVITPGQLGPISRVLYDFSAAFTLSMSTTGMPSVMHTMVAMPASAASNIASAAYGAGLLFLVVSALVAASVARLVLFS